MERYLCRIRMMGKTHIAGALASWTVVYPMVAKTTLSTTQNVMILTASISLAVLGGLLPDIDQPGSMIDQTLFGALGKSRIGAMLGGALLLVMSVFLRIPVLTAYVFHSPILQGLIKHYGTWISLALGAIGATLVIIALMKHRGITHTLLGMGLFLWMVDTLLGFLPILAPWRIALLFCFSAGYLSHLLLDIIADGVPLFYPLYKGFIRQPLPIHTGSLWDVVVIRFGLLAYFGFYVAHLYLPMALLTRLHL